MESSEQRGFTLIEMMVVVLIIASLVSIVSVAVLGRLEEGRRVAAKAQIRSFETALKFYKVDNGNYPDSQQGLKSLVEKPSVGKIPASWRPYLEGTSKIPKDPWGGEYRYTCCDEGGNYEIKSLGSDGEPGGEGKDADISSKSLDEP